MDSGGVLLASSGQLPIYGRSTILAATSFLITLCAHRVMAACLLDVKQLAGCQLVAGCGSSEARSLKLRPPNRKQCSNVQAILA